MYTDSEILILAEAWAKKHGISLATVGRRVLGNHAIFITIAGSGGCHSKSLERASRWFNEHWPQDEPWPLNRKAELPEWSSGPFAEPSSTSVSSSAFGGLSSTAPSSSTAR